MTCPFDKEKLTGYFDGELDGAEKAEVEKHISTCSECLRDLGEIKSAAGLVHSLPRLRAPASIAAEVRREVSATDRVHSLEKYRRSIFWTFSVAAGLLVVATISFFVGRTDGPMNDLARSTAVPRPAGKFARAPVGTESEAADAQRQAAENSAALRAVQESRRQVDERAETDRESATRRKAEGGAPQDKAADLKENRALAKQEFGGQGAPKPGSAPPAPKQPSAPTDALAKKNLADDRPASPSTPPAAAAPRKEEPLARKDGEKRVPAADAVAGKAGAKAPVAFTIASPQLAATREKTREMLVRWKALDRATPPAGPLNAGESASLTVELTDAQLAELRKSLESQAGVLVRAGAPAEAFRDAGQQAQAAKSAGGGGLGGKLAEEQKAQDPAARGAAPAKQDQPAPGAPGQAAGESKDQKAAEKAKSVDALQAPVPPEPRQKVVLHFVEIPPGK